jgi:hypothetical protein
MESRFGLFGTMLVSVQYTWFALNKPRARKSFWTHLMELLGDEAHVEARFGPFAYSANLDEVHGFAPNVL